MKKFLSEYKAVKKSRSEADASKQASDLSEPQPQRPPAPAADEVDHRSATKKQIVDSQQDMGVFKWLRRERVTVTTSHVNPPPTAEEQHPQSATQIGTIRTEEYKRDLAEFQARRSSGARELQETPVKKKCGRNSLPVSCTDCTMIHTDHDNTFNYEKKSAIKYKKKSHRRSRSASPEERVSEGLPNIQFLFQNQVFMPGNFLATSSHSEPQKSKRHSRQRVLRSPDMDFLVQKHIDFKDDDEQAKSPPVFFKNNSLPLDMKNFIDSLKSEDDEVDGVKAAGDVNTSGHCSENPNKDESGDERLWEVMSELKHLDQWADEQLQVQSPNATRSEDSKSDTSAYGLPVASARNLDVSLDRSKMWNNGKWGVVPVQMKKLSGVTVDHVKKKRNLEINILRKCRHPNIILLMGLYPDAQNNVHIICERCVDSLFGILHVQGRILSAQTSVKYALDIANALVFLRMQGYIHTELTSMSVMITSHDTAKLSDLGPCAKLKKIRERTEKDYDIYSPEPHYVNIEDTRQTSVADCEPLLSENPSETYLVANAVAKDHSIYKDSELYCWQAPELFVPNEDGLVYPCSKSDVYSLCLILMESCNASIPWKNLTYDKLFEQYTLWKTGVPLPHDGTYPGCLLALLQCGLKIQRNDRMDLNTLQNTLQSVKSSLDQIGYIIIPARLPNKKTSFSSPAWDTTSPTDSECLSPQNIEHKAVVHKVRDSSTESEKECSKSDHSPLYETIRKTHSRITCSIAEKCFISDEEDEQDRPVLKYDLIPEKDYSSACSTPIAKIRARIKDIGTSGALHQSDSTEYCSFLSPNRTVNLGLNDTSTKDNSSAERPMAKLSRSFTPMSYKPLHIKVPEFNLDSIKPLLKDQNCMDMEKSSYNFDIKNYSLPSTPIARSNKLRKNAWLSGDLNVVEQCADKLRDGVTKLANKEDSKNICSAPETPAVSTDSPLEKIRKTSVDFSPPQYLTRQNSPESVDTVRDSITGLRRINPPQDFLSPETDENNRDWMNSWSLKSSQERTNVKPKVEDEILANVNVKPLVAIHERWIYEANRKTGRSMSLPEDNRCHIAAVKPASHCVDTLQKSLPQLNGRRSSGKCYRARPPSPCNGSQWEQFCQARETIAKNVNFGVRETDRYNTYRKDSMDKGVITEETSEPKMDQATDTRCIEEFIRDLIRKEFQQYLHEISDDTSTTVSKNDDILNKGVANIMESLRSTDEDKSKKASTKSYSRVKINGNNKPLLQITFSRSGENSLQVLDNCVNVTFCDTNNGGREKMSHSMEETLIAEEGQVNALKRCQAFNALQEARSTEDLYIDDDLSTQLQENFGGKVKLIPLHGSLHEVLCEKEDECCLIKVKQENGCDTIYFRCDNSDTESRDAIDGCSHDASQDTVVFKRSISLIEERIQRVFPKDKRTHTPVATRKPKPKEIVMKVRPKSEMFLPVPNIKESRPLSISSPSLVSNDRDEVEVNIENVMCYQDSSSDECLKCQTDNDDFEMLERKIEEDIANSNLSSLTCGCLEKISEENLSVVNEEVTDRN